MVPALTPGPAGRSPLSIIIPTYGRDDVLWNTLRALEPQLAAGDEIVLVDQNNPPLRLPKELDGLPIRLAAQTLPSLTRARNLGLRTARNDRVVFLDDDIEPWPDMLAMFSRAADAHSRSILTGVVEQDDHPRDLDGVGFVDLDSGEIRTDYTRPISGEIPFFPGGFFLMRKSELPKGLEFCPGFRGAAQGEEIDFALRAKKAGLRFISVPSVGMRHLKAPSGGCRSIAFRQRFFLDEVYNRGLFFGRHGRWPSLRKFLRRSRGFVEFHSRRPGGHRPDTVLKAAWTLSLGFLRGAALRVQDGIRPVSLPSPKNISAPRG